MDIDADFNNGQQEDVSLCMPSICVHLKDYLQEPGGLNDMVVDQVVGPSATQGVFLSRRITESVDILIVSVVNQPSNTLGGFQSRASGSVSLPRKPVSSSSATATAAKRARIGGDNPTGTVTGEGDPPEDGQAPSKKLRAARNSKKDPAKPPADHHRGSMTPIQRSIVEHAIELFRLFLARTNAFPSNEQAAFEAKELIAVAIDWKESNDERFIRGNFQPQMIACAHVICRKP